MRAGRRLRFRAKKKQRAARERLLRSSGSPCVSLPHASAFSAARRARLQP